MTTQLKPQPHPVSAAEPQLRRFTVSEYYAMVEAGILNEDDRVELLDGVIFEMAPMAGPHIGGINRFTRILPAAIGERAILQVQCPVRLDDSTEPEPDLALLRECADFYDSGPAGPEDVLLLIEVSDTTADYDRSEKLPRYARAGIPEVWISVLPEGIIEAHADPSGGVYTRKSIYAPGDTITPGCFPDIALPVDRILSS